MLKKMRHSPVLWLFAILTFSVISGCSTSGDSSKGLSQAATAPSQTTDLEKPASVELTISAAASLKDSLNEIQKLYEAKAPQVKLTYNYGASGTLQKQIEQGAPADLFISAGKKQMDALADKKLVDASSVTNILLNELVLVVPSDSQGSLSKIEDLSNESYKKIAVGTPESVPAGSYAKEALTYFKLWDVLQPKVVLTKDVKQVLSYVETGNADAGFVYKTDALTSTKVKAVLTIDPKSHKDIIYPIGIINATKNRKEAEAFYQFLQTKEAAGVFEKYGFGLPR